MLSARLVGFVVAVCLVPPLLQWFGFDFSTAQYTVDWSKVDANASQNVEALFVTRGQTVHTLIEWTGVCIALLAAIFSLVHYSLKRDVTTPVIATALMFSALLDGFRVLAIDRLFFELADPDAFAVVTWALSRIFLITMMISGLFPFLVRRRTKQIASTDLRDFLLLAIAYVMAAVTIIYYAGQFVGFDEEQSVATALARRLNLIALLLFALGGGVVLTLYNSKFSSVFATALVASVIPHSAAQIYVTFQSDALFDAGSNLASFYKLLGYFVPVVGLIFDYRRASQADAELATTERQLSIARDIQNSLLPSGKPESQTFDVAGYSVASEAVGGDYYDFIPLPDKTLLIVVADVSGHDLGAALLMANARAYLKAWAEDESDIAEMINSLNRFVSRDACGRRFVTAMLVKASEDGTLTYTCAGHTGYIIQADGSRITLGQRNVPLGVLDTMQAVPATTRLESDQALLLITDGIAEMPNAAGEPFGLDRITQLILNQRAASSDETLATLRQEISRWSGRGKPFDDTTVVLVKTVPSKPPSTD